MKYIVTHHGQAHRDDLYVVSLALVLHPEIEEVYRRDPTPAELEDQEVLVLDVGGRHEPEKNNFDHHQLPRDAAPECALSLYLRAKGLEEKFKLFEWYQTTAMMDSKGPFYTAKQLGVDSNVLFKLGSPMEGAILRLFESSVSLGDCDICALRGVGKEMLRVVTELSERLEWLKANAQVRATVDGLKVLVFETKDTEGSVKFRELYHPDAAVSVSWDDRGDGWALYRYADHPKIDFSILDGEPGIEFAHKGGFIAKTKSRIPIWDALALVEKAVK